MSSLLNNVSAVSALRVLQANDSAIRRTQGQMTTGLKVASAQDNAAYWSIATSMKTEVGKLQAVDDGLDLVSGILSTTSSALTQILTLTQGIAKDLVTAQGSGVDPALLAADIAVKQQGIVAAGISASFNGTNWLVNRTTTVHSLGDDIAWNGTYADVYQNNGATPISYTRRRTDTIETISNSGEGSSASVTTTLDSSGTYTPATRYYANGPSASGPTTTSGTPTDSASVNILFSPTDLESVDLKPFALFETGVDIEVGATDHETFTDGARDFPSGTTEIRTAALTPTGGYALDGSIALSNGTTTILTFNPTKMSNDDLATVGKAVDGALARIQNTMTSVAGLQSQVDGTKTLISAISDALTAGIGSLVDADIDQVSTRLIALQTQRDLSVQSLALANNTAQMVLKLFA